MRTARKPKRWSDVTVRLSRRPGQGWYVTAYDTYTRRENIDGSDPGGVYSPQARLVDLTLEGRREFRVAAQDALLIGAAIRGLVEAAADASAAVWPEQDPLPGV